MTVAEFRDILGTTRKYALPILEYLDSNKITLRVGDVRKFLLKS
jgi:selenocysteine-specific elongation factor